jgi:hypothetical protein
LTTSEEGLITLTYIFKQRGLNLGLGSLLLIFWAQLQAPSCDSQGVLHNHMMTIKLNNLNKVFIEVRGGNPNLMTERVIPGKRSQIHV